MSVQEEKWRTPVSRSEVGRVAPAVTAELLNIKTTFPFPKPYTVPTPYFSITSSIIHLLRAATSTGIPTPIKQAVRPPQKLPLKNQLPCPLPHA